MDDNDTSMASIMARLPFIWTRVSFSWSWLFLLLPGLLWVLISHRGFTLTEAYLDNGQSIAVAAAVFACVCVCVCDEVTPIELVKQWALFVFVSQRISLGSLMLFTLFEFWWHLGRCFLLQRPTSPASPEQTHTRRQIEPSSSAVAVACKQWQFLTSVLSVYVCLMCCK